MRTLIDSFTYCELGVQLITYLYGVVSSLVRPSQLVTCLEKDSLVIYCAMSA